MNSKLFTKLKSSAIGLQRSFGNFRDRGFNLRRGFSSAYTRLPRTILGFQYYQILLGANLAVFLLWNSGIVNHNTMLRHFALSKATLAQGNIHTLLTYSISHIDGWHLFANAITLFFFGRNIELVFGAKRLLQLYIGGALAGALMQLPGYGTYNFLLGASSSTSAILSYFILSFPYEIIYLYFFPVPAWAFGLGFFGYSYLMMNSNSGGIAHGAHLGGLVFGAGMFMATRGRRFW